MTVSDELLAQLPNPPEGCYWDTVWGGFIALDNADPAPGDGAFGLIHIHEYPDEEIYYTISHRPHTNNCDWVRNDASDEYRTLADAAAALIEKPREINMITETKHKGRRTDSAALIRGLRGIKATADSPTAWNDIYTDGGHGEMARATLTQIVDDSRRLLSLLDPDDPRYVVFEAKTARRILTCVQQIAGALDTIDRSFSHEGDERSALMERAIADGQGRAKAAIMQLRKEVRSDD